MVTEKIIQILFSCGEFGRQEDHLKSNIIELTRKELLGQEKVKIPGSLTIGEEVLWSIITASDSYTPFL